MTAQARNPRHSCRGGRQWGRVLYESTGEMPYLVGSTLTRSDWRDVDVRIIVDTAPGAYFGPWLGDRRGNFLLSLWGQQATGLPIDCQIQSQHEANQHDGYRHALGLSREKGTRCPTPLTGVNHDEEDS